MRSSSRDNARHLFLNAATCYVAVLLSIVASASDGQLPRVTPESQGVLSTPIIEYFDSMMAYPNAEIHSIIVMRHGNVIAETYPKPFDADYGHILYSCSKTFVSAAVGIAIGENRLRLEDRVAAFFPECLPDSVSSSLAQMTVRHLLTMTSGVEPDWQMRSECDDWTRAFLAKPVENPGQKFQYDSMCTYMLAAIVEKVTGMKLVDYLNQRVFSTLGITDAQWEVSPEGHNTGGWGLRLKSESLAKFGQLLLQEGRWEGRQLIPAEWVKQMMSRQADGGSDGYGFQMWMCERPGTVRADGAYGQFIYVIPDMDMVVVVTQCSTMDFSEQRRLLWRVLDEAVVSESASIKESAATKKLARKQASYVLPVAEGKATGKCSDKLLGRTIVLDANKYGWTEMRISSEDRNVVLALTDAQGRITRVVCGHGRWVTSENQTPPVYSITARGQFEGTSAPYRVAGSYGWEQDGRLNVKVKYVDWITPLDFCIYLNGDDIAVSVCGDTLFTR